MYIGKAKGNVIIHQLNDGINKYLMPINIQNIVVAVTA